MMLKANDAVIYFDNVCDENGRKLVKSEKRTRLKNMMRKLYEEKDRNIFILSNGQSVPLIICCKFPQRAAFYCFNDIEPKDEILEAFAAKTGITYKKEKNPPKKQGELIANEAKQLLDNVTEDGRKLTGIEKLEKLHEFFTTLYHSPENNICDTPKGKIPIIVRRVGINNKTALCLNTAEYRNEVFSAFAAKTDCIYLADKENAEMPPQKQKGEMTARECARIFHNVPNVDGSDIKKDASPKLVEWFNYIYTHPSVNSIRLPDGKTVPLLIYRRSHAQKCLCLNTSDETIKPFVIRKMAVVTGADICLDNIRLSTQNPLQLHHAIIYLTKAQYQTKNSTEIAYYRAYAQKAYGVMAPHAPEITVSEWLKHQAGRNGNS